MSYARALATALLVTAAAPALSQGANDAGFSSALTNRIASELRSGFDLCRTIDTVYRLDCYRQSYSDAARTLSNAAAYWEAQVALKRVDRTLTGVLSEFQDRDASRLRAGGNRLKAVQADAVQSAAVALSEAVGQAEKFLRQGNSVEIEYFGPIADEVAKSADLFAN